MSGTGKQRCPHPVPSHPMVCINLSGRSRLCTAPCMNGVRSREGGTPARARLRFSRNSIDISAVLSLSMIHPRSLSSLPLPSPFHSIPFRSPCACTAGPGPGPTHRCRASLSVAPRGAKEFSSNVLSKRERETHIRLPPGLSLLQRCK